MVPRVLRSCFVSAAAAWMSSHHTADALHMDRISQPSPGGGSDKAEMAALKPDASAELMPLHQHLGIHFVQHAGPDLRGVLANLSAAGLKPRYSLEEMQKTGPTLWKKHWTTEECIRHKDRQSKSTYFLECSGHRTIIWTPRYKLGYMKTAKAASTAFSAYFYERFPDATETMDAEDVPEDVFIFTFTREPFEHKLAAFAEVDLKTESGDETEGHDNSTRFQNIKHQNHYTRFSIFLDDVRLHRFQEGDARKPGHAGNQIGAALCERTPNYIGHLENLEADWDRIQRFASLPWALRTTALPIVHADTSTQHHLYSNDESIPMDDTLREKICRGYSSEFACLGYFVPTYCMPFI